MKLCHFFLISLITMYAACSSPATIQEEWTNPAQKKDSTKIFQKILFVALLKNDAARRIAEDKLVAEVKERGVASYTYLGSINAISDENVISEKLKRDG